VLTHLSDLVAHRIYLSKVKVSDDELGSSFGEGERVRVIEKHFKFLRSNLTLVLLFPVALGCAPKEDTLNSNPNSKSYSSFSLQETDAGDWAPSFANTGAYPYHSGEVTRTLGSVNNKANIVATRDSYSGTQVITGLGQGYNSGRLASFTFAVEDLGANGSISLVAQTTAYPSDLTGSAYPVLVSLVHQETSRELINLSSTCNSGLYACTASSCVPRSGCKPNFPSAYESMDHFLESQVPAFGYASNNTFPSCKWTGTAPGVGANGAWGGGDDTAGVIRNCGFMDALSTGPVTGNPQLDSTSWSSSSALSFTSGGKLRQGTYTASYLLMASHYKEVNGRSATMKLDVIKRVNPDARAAQNGAIDLNVVIVGSANISDARTVNGKRNLNDLFKYVYDHFSAYESNSGNALHRYGPGIRLGTIRVYKLAGSAGEAFADTDIEQLGELFGSGSLGVDQTTETKAVNVFLVSRIPYSSANVTILGVAGAINGPSIFGTGSSGVAFSTFDKLDTYNPSCSGALSCHPSLRESEFKNMGTTISHEIGHFLGLNHPTESDGLSHDPIPDTPQVIKGSANPYVVHDSCRAPASTGTPDSAVCLAQTSSPAYNGVSTFYPDVAACQFNHTMWYTTKRFQSSSAVGDGNLFSPQSSDILNFNTLVR
jgi:hypothetical protein